VTFDRVWNEVVFGVQLVIGTGLAVEVKGRVAYQEARGRTTEGPEMSHTDAAVRAAARAAR